jgi:transglutaminase-like putative cysteine protease
VNARLTVTAATATVLASAAMYPLMVTTRWFWLGMGAAILAAAIGTATRLRALPAVVCFLASLAGLFLYLNLLFAGPQSFWRVVPTTASLHHLASLVTLAQAEIAKYAPPVPPRPGILLLTTAGIGLVAASTDLVAVRLRRPAIAGLPLLVLFCVPLTTSVRPGGFGSAVVFCLGITGYLALLSAEGRERVRLWGRLVRPWPGGSVSAGPDTRQLTAAGRRIGFAAVVLALMVPLFLPGLRQHQLVAGSGTAVGRGYTGALSLPQPLVQMNQQLRAPHPQTVLTYRSSATFTPPYLQIYVLGRLGTNDWSMAPPSATSALGKGPLPTVPGLSTAIPTAEIHETISLGRNLGSSSHQENYLPVPYAPRSLAVPGDWRVDPNSLTVLGAGTQLAGLRYSVTSKNVEPSPQQLRRSAAAPASESGYLTVPLAFRPLLPLTKRITAGRTSRYEQAVALQQWFTRPGNFTYSLNVSQPRDASALLTFLTQTKRGYCQQFAFAMAVMARLLGIPSRVVVGYTQGSYQGNARWAVRTSDAHAWPELYFTGAGWLRFEPTPSGSSGHAGQATASPPPYSYPAPAGGVPTQLPTAAANPGAARPSTGPQSGLNAKLRRLAGAGAPGAGRRNTAPLSAGLIIAVMLVVIAVTPRTTRSLIRRRRWLRASGDAGLAHAAWAEMRDDLADHRIACRASESPRALARRLIKTLDLGPEQRAALDRIARAEERARYAISPVASEGLRADVTAVRRAVAASCRPGTRWAARVMPASIVTPAWAALQNALDVFGWIDVIATGLRRGGRGPDRQGGRSQPASSWRIDDLPAPAVRANGQEARLTASRPG